jgi:hypothetical protein
MPDRAGVAVLTAEVLDLSLRPPVRRVGVLCGTEEGAGGQYLSFAAELGARFGAVGLGVVCGGAPVGVLGRLVRTAHAAGSPVNNVVPLSSLGGGVPKVGGTVLQAVRTEDERIKLVHRLADGFVVLPGGVEVLRELAELMALEQARGLARPIVLVNRRGFFDPLVALLAQAEADDFATSAQVRMLDVADTADDVLRLLGRHTP